MFKVREIENPRTFAFTKIYGVFDDDGFLAGPLHSYVPLAEARSWEVPKGMGFVEATRVARERNELI